MRVMFWFCDTFAWTPAMKTLEDAAEAQPETIEKAVVAYIHVEPKDVLPGSSAETKLIKNAKWVARKWDVKTVVLHSFTHLGEDKADPEEAGNLILRARDRLKDAEYEPVLTPYGYYLDLEIKAVGHPLARIYKEF